MNIVLGALRAASLRRIAVPLAAALVGAGVVYLAGFAHADALHDNAHDARHAANFPCH